MDVITGNIISPETFKKLMEEGDDEWKIKNYISMKIPPTKTQLSRGRVGRNEPCPCGSGKKFKKCHLKKQDKEIVGTNSGRFETKKPNQTNIPKSKKVKIDNVTT